MAGGGGLHQIVRITHAHKILRARAHAGSRTHPINRLGKQGLSGFRLQLAIAAPLRGGEMAASSDVPTQKEVDQLFVSTLV